MVQFLKLQYRMGRIKEDQLDQLIAKGTITKEEKVEIMS